MFQPVYNGVMIRANLFSLKDAMFKITYFRMLLSCYMFNTGVCMGVNVTHLAIVNLNWVIASVTDLENSFYVRLKHSLRSRSSQYAIHIANVDDRCRVWENFILLFYTCNMRIQSENYWYRLTLILLSEICTCPWESCNLLPPTI